MKSISHSRELSSPAFAVTRQLDLSPVMLGQRKVAAPERLANNRYLLGIETHKPGTDRIHAGRMNAEHKGAGGHWIRVHRSASLAGDNAVYQNVVRLAMARTRGTKAPIRISV